MDTVDDAVSENATLGERYRLLRLLGRGAHGAVFEAEHAHLGRRCAVKILGPGIELHQARQRFDREARVLACLAHENVVGVIDAGEDPVRGQYLVLELVPGRTLREESEAVRSAGTGRVVEVALQIARGLEHAHAMGIIHRDLKPENVMLTTHADGRLLVKILDFGIARIVDSDADTITKTGGAVGTAAYMAPEQARGDRDLDARVDVYALGVIVYELLAGARPFIGISYNETIFRILSEPHVPLHRVCPELPSEFCAEVDRALAKQKESRRASALEFAEALARARQPLAGSLNTGGAAPLTVVPHGTAVDVQVVAAVTDAAVEVKRSNERAPRPALFLPMAVLSVSLLSAGLGAGLTYWLARPGVVPSVTTSASAALGELSRSPETSASAQEPSRRSSGEVALGAPASAVLSSGAMSPAPLGSALGPRPATGRSRPNSPPSPHARGEATTKASDPASERGYVTDSPY